MSIVTYECVSLNALNHCNAWQDVDENATLNQSEQYSLLLAILGVMVLVWVFKLIKRLI